MWSLIFTAYRFFTLQNHINSSVFYWNSAHLIGSATAFYSPIEKNYRARVAFLLAVPRRQFAHRKIGLDV